MTVAAATWALVPDDSGATLAAVLLHKHPLRSWGAWSPEQAENLASARG